jgi:hypothetical protein
LQEWELSLENMRSLEIGQFRLGGEVHQWMYDRYSLSCVLKEAGFCDPVIKTATTSRISDWNNNNLDSLPDGTMIKPDLFSMEALKMGAQIDG